MTVHGTNTSVALELPAIMADGFMYTSHPNEQKSQLLSHLARAIEICPLNGDNCQYCNWAVLREGKIRREIVICKNITAIYLSGPKPKADKIICVFWKRALYRRRNGLYVSNGSYIACYDKSFILAWTVEDPVACRSPIVAIRINCLSVINLEISCNLDGADYMNYDNGEWASSLAIR